MIGGGVFVLSELAVAKSRPRALGAYGLAGNVMMLSALSASA